MSKEQRKSSPELDLGKKVEAPIHYAPDVLRRVVREQERGSLVKAGVYPEFFGYDVWNAYEFNFLVVGGGPQNYVLKIIYPASSPYIVESKSLKLYLGSFSMDRFTSLKEALDTVTKDLNELLETHVQVRAMRVAEVNGFQRTFSIGDGVKVLDDLAADVPCTEFNHNAELLQEGKSKGLTETHQYVFYGLKSNCKVTHQPDYGAVFIKYTGPDQIDPKALYKYLVSFRGENHFHEEIVETIYTDLLINLPNASSLVVFAQYTRRGGIDINPVRALTLNDLTWLPCEELLMDSPGIVRSFMQ